MTRSPGEPPTPLESRTSTTTAGSGGSPLPVGLALAGLGVVAFIFWRIGWPDIRANLAIIGPRVFLALLALNAVAQGGFVLTLKSVLPRDSPRPSFASLYAVYLMGDAVSYVAPASGEPLKVHLLRDSGGAAAATATVTLQKHADLFAQCVFACVGVGVALSIYDLPRTVFWGAIGGGFVLIALLSLMTWALSRGAFSRILRRAAGWRLLASRMERLAAGAELADARIRQFHAERRASFALAIGGSLVGWCGGVFETWIVLRILAPGARFTTALAIEALTMVLNNAFLFVPGRLGGAEGVRTAVFVLAGLPPSQGAASALVRRTREIIWVLAGWLLLWRQGPRLHRRSERGDTLLVDPPELSGTEKTG